ncbi:MAG: RnfABCDGE type electron transport complex subunit D [Clostridia bacterium]|nr:RnfABCDGE type electron transport complex subunit D [Clostridia bacterium]
MTSPDSELLVLSSSPHVKHKNNTRSIMLDVIIAMLPALVWSVVTFGWRPLMLTFVSVLSCISFEYGFQRLTNRPTTVNDLSAVVTGMLLAFNVPSHAAWWLMPIGAFFAIVIVKQLFGGIGKNVVNPAIAARIFLFVSWPAQLTGFNQPFTDAVSSATPLSFLKTGVIPEGYSILDMFLGLCPGCLGEVSSLLLLVGGIYLLVRRVITWHIPVAYLGTVAALAFIFPQAGGGLEYMAYTLFSGGLMLGAFFMATDYTTSPVTYKGRLLYGFGCGVLTVMIRYFGAYPEGVSFSIMIMNLLVWYIDRLTIPVKFGGKKKGKV